jgi:hypothetical protein
MHHYGTLFSEFNQSATNLQFISNVYPEFTFLGRRFRIQDSGRLILQCGIDKGHPTFVRSKAIGLVEKRG